MNALRRLITPLIALIRLHLLALGIIAALVLLYTLVGFFAVPRIARAQLESYVTEQLHRQVSVGEIRFNPYAFDTSIANFALREADGSPVVSFRHLYVNAELASLWQRAVVLKEVQLAAPDIEVSIAKDGTVNLAKLAPESPPETTAQPAEEETAPPRVRIGRLEVKEGRVGLTDHSHEHSFAAALTPVKFTLTDFKTDANYENAYDFSGTTLSGEQLDWAGNFTVQPLGSTGRFRVQGLRAATIDSYAAGMLPFQLASGNATLAGDYRLAMTPTLAIEATLPLLQLREFSMKERDSPTAPVQIPEVDVHDIAFSYEKRDLGVKRVDVKGAHIDVAREANGSISLMRLFGNGTTESEPPAASASPSPPADTTAPAGSQKDDGAWRVHVDAIQLSEAAVLAEDRSVSPVAKFELAPIALTIAG